MIRAELCLGVVEVPATHHLHLRLTRVNFLGHFSPEIRRSSGRGDRRRSACGSPRLRAVESRGDQERITDLTVATTTEAGREIGHDLPPWARPHLASNAAVGRCVHGPHQLQSLYRRIDAYRHKAGVENAEQPAVAAEALLGATPEDPVLRARRRALAEEAFGPAAALTRSGPAPAGR